MVWDCMSWEGVDKFHHSKGIVDRFVYSDILEIELIGTIYIQGLEEIVIFQDDTNLEHSSHYVKDWLLVQKFQVIWHSLQSPNLNPT